MRSRNPCGVFKSCSSASSLSLKPSPLSRLDRLARAIERLLEALLVERLQQVVDGVHLEGLQRVLVVRGHEDGDGQLAVAEALHDFEAVELGNLHVEEQSAGLSRRITSTASRPSRHSPITSMSLFAPEQRPDALPGERLVVDDQRPDHSGFFVAQESKLVYE